MRLCTAVLLVLCSACAPAQDATWLQGAWFNWEAFNHRLSYLDYSVADDRVITGVVGGTSTSGVVGSDPPAYAARWRRSGGSTTSTSFGWFTSIWTQGAPSS